MSADPFGQLMNGGQADFEPPLFEPLDGFGATDFQVHCPDAVVARFLQRVDYFLCLGDFALQGENPIFLGGGADVSVLDRAIGRDSNPTPVRMSGQAPKWGEGTS